MCRIRAVAGQVFANGRARQFCARDWAFGIHAKSMESCRALVAMSGASKKNVCQLVKAKTSADPVRAYV